MSLHIFYSFLTWYIYNNARQWIHFLILLHVNDCEANFQEDNAQTYSVSHPPDTQYRSKKFSLSLARSTIIVLMPSVSKNDCTFFNKLLSQNQLISVISTAEWGVFTQKKNPPGQNKFQLKLDVPFSFRVDRSYCQPLILIFHYSIA